MITYCSCTRAAPRPRALAQPAARIDRGAHTGPPQPPLGRGTSTRGPGPVPRPVAPAAREARARRQRSAREAVDGVSRKPGLRPSWRRATAPTLGPATALSRAPPTRPVARGAAPTTRARGRLGRLPGVAPVLHTCLTAGVAPRRSASARGARRHAAHAPRRAGHCAPNRCPRVKPARPKPRAIGTTTAERLLRSMRPPRPLKLRSRTRRVFWPPRTRPQPRRFAPRRRSARGHARDRSSSAGRRPARASGAVKAAGQNLSAPACVT